MQSNQHRASQVELLEIRRLLTTFTVTNLDPSGDGSLAATIASANDTAGADVIDFSSAVRGTINLSQSLLVTDSLDIRGPGSSELTIHAPTVGEGDDAVFRVQGDNTMNVRIAGLTITGGDYDGGGAGINVESVKLTVDSCLLSENATITSEGGAIHSLGADLTVRDSTFLHNRTEGSLGGGAICVEGGSLHVSGSTFENNESNGGTIGGGAIAISGANADIRNSTFVGNSQDAGFGGGAILIDDSSLLLQNCTVAGNSATDLEDPTGGGGGGISMLSGLLTLDSTIIADNTTDGAADSHDLWRSTGSIVASHSLIESSAPNALDLSSDGNLLGVDPKLGDLADNGGPTRTLSLNANSPAIDAGSNPANLANDQRGAGFSRVIGASADIGAFEDQTASPTPTPTPTPSPTPTPTPTPTPSPTPTPTPTLPTAAVSDVSVVESSGAAVFSVTLSKVSDTDVSIDYATADGSAVAGSDYAAKSGTLVIPAGQTAGTVTVAVVDDAAKEAAETFVLNLSGAVGANLGNAQGNGTIENDDAGPQLVAAVAGVLPASVIGGAKGATSVTLANQGDAPFAGPATINVYASADGNLDDADLLVGTLTKKFKLGSGQAKPVKMKLLFPAGLDGNFSLLSRVVAAGSLNTNVQSGVPRSININPPFVELAGTWLTIPSAAVSGGKLSGALSLTNNGNQSVKKTIQTALFASSDSILDASDVPLGVVTQKVNLKNGRTKAARFKLTLPVGLTAGNFHLIASVDSTHVVPEPDDQNDVAAESTTSLS